MVLSYNLRDCAFTKNRAIKGITKRRFDGELIAVSGVLGTGIPFSSSYTPNHHCVINFTGLRDKWAVYLMQKENQFRVGVCKMDYGRVGCGPMARMRAEGAESCWVLKTEDTKVAAVATENAIAANYGLPAVMFTIKNNSAIIQEELDSTWANIWPNANRGLKCLKAFGRDERFPLFSGKRPWLESLKRPMVTHACNIVDGCSVLPYVPYTHTAKKSDWCSVVVKRVPYHGNVYSLDVEKDHLYVADGIVTHNCQAIYGFAGADNDAMGIIQREMGSVELPLSVTYRCPKLVVELAQQWVPDYTAHPSAPDGIVRTLHHTDLWTERFNPTTDAILCRMTRPLVGIAINLRNQGIPCVVEGQSAKSLVYLANKFGDVGIDRFRELLGGYLEEQVQKYTLEDNLEKVARVRDRVGSVMSIAQSMGQATTARDLVRQIVMMFRDQTGHGCLTLCTIHRSKGREWDRVFLIGRNRYQPGWWASQEWELQQEKNLEYVAVTRTKRELVEVDVPEVEVGKRGERQWWELD